MVKCEEVEPVREQADQAKAEGNKLPYSLCSSPPRRQPMAPIRQVRSSINISVDTNQARESRRSHSFGGLAGGSFLRLHEVAIQKINEVDEDKLPSTRRSKPDERPSSGNSKQMDQPEGQRTNSKACSMSSSSAGSSKFSEQIRSSVNMDSPAAVEPQLAQGAQPAVP